MNFKVKKLPRYKKAKYPSYKNDLNISRYSFPFSGKLKYTAGSLALLAGCFGLSNMAMGEPDKIKKPKPEKQIIMGKMVKRPNLNEADIIPIVKKVFIDAGLNVKENVAYKEDKIECEIDLYDNVKKVGFEFLSYNDYESQYSKTPADKGFTNDEVKLLKDNSRENAPNIFTISYSDWNYKPSNNSEEAKQQAFKKLEEAVRQYIKQLKEQGVL